MDIKKVSYGLTSLSSTIQSISEEDGPKITNVAISALGSEFSTENLQKGSFEEYTKEGPYEVTNPEVIQLSTALGYFPLQGLCKGVARKGWEAILSNGIEAFDNRIKKIGVLFQRLKKEGRSLEELAQKKTDENIKYLRKTIESIDPDFYTDLLAFFDGVCLGQQAGLYRDFFEKEKASVILSQNHSDCSKEISLLTNPLNLEEAGGAEEIARFTGVYTEEELIKYFYGLRKILEQDPSQDPFVLQLTSLDHAISVGYDLINRDWFFIDINQLCIRRIGDDALMAKKVFSALFPNPFAKNGMATFGYCAKNSLKASKEKINLWKNTEEFQEVHKVTQEKAQFYMNVWTKSNISWLFGAAQIGDINTVLALIEAGADVNRATPDGLTALYIASQNDHAEIVKVLVKSNAIVDKSLSDGSTPLHAAAHHGHVNSVKILLESKADINAIRPDGATPLMLAAQKGHLEVVELLLEAGVDVNKAKPGGGRTALIMAVSNRHAEIVKALLNRGADKNLMSQDQTPLFLARKKGFDEIIALLS